MIDIQRVLWTLAAQTVRDGFRTLSEGTSYLYYLPHGLDLEIVGE